MQNAGPFSDKNIEKKSLQAAGKMKVLKMS
jgi:hypothetical protein